MDLSALWKNGSEQGITVNVTNNNHYEQKNTFSPARSSNRSKRLKAEIPELDPKAVEATTFTNVDKKLVPTVHFQGFLTNDRLLWSVNFKKYLKTYSFLAEKNKSPEHTFMILLKAVKNALDKHPLINDKDMDWLNHDHYDVTALREFVTKNGMPIEPQPIITVILLQNPILFAGWFATEESRNLARDTYKRNFYTPCAICNNHSPFKKILHSELKKTNKYYRQADPILHKCLYPDNLMSHLQNPDANAYATATFDTHFIAMHKFFHTLLEELDQLDFIKAINDDYKLALPDDKEFDDEDNEVEVITDNQLPAIEEGPGDNNQKKPAEQGVNNHKKPAEQGDQNQKNSDDADMGA